MWSQRQMVTPQRGYSGPSYIIQGVTPQSDHKERYRGIIDDTKSVQNVIKLPWTGECSLFYLKTQMNKEQQQKNPLNS
jgi:hypothetical protein